MAIISRRPLTNSLREQQFVKIEGLEEGKKERSLLASHGKRISGRNTYGRITCRHRGGGAKRLYRIIDFSRQIKGVPATVNNFEYDPNRNVSIALLVYENGAKKYILRPEGLVKGDKVVAGVDVEVKVGNCLPLSKVPVGFSVHNVELEPGRGARIARSAGSSVQLVSKEGGKALLKMPSSELRYVNLDCWATIGVLSNAEFKNASLGKAGRTRHRGFRPTVRGMAMNPVDHPHGGGEGRSKSGSHPSTPWGKSCKGARTRKKNRGIGVIVKRRSRGKGK